MSEEYYNNVEKDSAESREFLDDKPLDSDRQSILFTDSPLLKELDDNYNTEENLTSSNGFDGLKLYDMQDQPELLQFSSI